MLRNLFGLNLRGPALVSRSFHCSPRRLQDPIFDPTQLNPIRLKDSNPKNQEPLINLKPRGFQDKSLSQSRVAAFDLQPKDDALSSRLTGVTAGRTVDVYNNDTAAACRQLNSVMLSNKIPQTKKAQRFYLKPGKVAEIKRSQRHRRDFMKGFKRLIEVVKDAKRKGY
ncbi:hypothetical protein ZYGR_0E01820 [Zygosaccharomyces rouxii]|uniref:ZYRO0B04048p n=2 Tax=Zygosaccharomyces rouxii TaxID=4956 RepID=C5DQY7_ZYGRC|nr:uncharacterized protein ZYRO0B04048g [Zygosaccharomyces rouxii]KAH9200253.1 hypothetical protein LQ764DRAFT_234738 [Zygosaccharomyces rouxii]GAV47166.1 hypothetical protein ZYGR_0E01820 [Zygosaccharomyces rouxii]CAR26198.1 ZYRO0B04048p [Zygosaccharomyces rouxii]